MGQSEEAWRDLVSHGEAEVRACAARLSAARQTLARARAAHRAVWLPRFVAACRSDARRAARLRDAARVRLEAWRSALALVTGGVL